ncbi:MAG: site-specific integrase, partial [Paramuribaculum sp.]|nr:site-specific integrase [Paramuribaculum sp.]
LTLYVARHSWASIARTKGIPLNTISLGLGHESESTTRIYLASIDNTAIDRANARILSGL